MDRVRAMTVDQRGLAKVDGRGRVRGGCPSTRSAERGSSPRSRSCAGTSAGVLYEAGRATPSTCSTTRSPGLRQDDERSRRHVRERRAAPVRAGRRRRRAALRGAAARVRPGPSASGRWTATWPGSPRPRRRPRRLVPDAQRPAAASRRCSRAAPGETKAGLAFRRGRPPRSTATPPPAGPARGHFAGAGGRSRGCSTPCAAAPDFSFDSVGQVHLPLVERPRGAARRRRVLPHAAHRARHEPGAGGGVRAGRGARRGRRRPPGGVRPVRGGPAPYVTTGQELPPGGVGGYAPKSALAIRLGALSMRSMTRWPMRGILEKQFAKAGDIALPDYCFAG